MRRVVFLQRSIVALGAALFVLAAIPSAGFGYPRPGTTERVSVASDGSRGRPGPPAPQISPGGIAISWDGRYVAFESAHDNLVPNDRNAVADIFLHDRRSRTTSLVSVAPDGTPAIGACGDADSDGAFVQVGSEAPSISANGRYISFSSCATNIVVGDTNLGRDVFVHDAATGRTIRVSISSDGEQASCPDVPCTEASLQSISADGRYVAFSGWADNLVAGDTNEYFDHFVRDLKTSTTSRVSVSSSGDQQMGTHWGCSPRVGPAAISARGRFVAFTSSGWGLAPGPGSDNRQEHFYVHDRKTGKTELIDVSNDGTPAEWGGLYAAVGSCQGPIGISASGRHVAFATAAHNLVPNDTNDLWDVFVHDRRTHTTQRVSVSSDGEEAAPFVLDRLVNFANGVFGMAISPDGRHVAFISRAANLTDEQQQGAFQAYVHDLRTGATDQVSLTAEGDVSRANCIFAALSRVGRHAAFDCAGEDLVSSEFSSVANDAYVRDRGLPLGVNGLVALGRAPAVSVLGAPRFEHTGRLLVRDATSDALASRLGAGGELTGAVMTYRPLVNDIHFDLRLASMPPTPVLAASTAGTVYGVSLEIDDKPYELRAASTGVGPRGETTAAFGLFSCSGTSFGPRCYKVADLKGGFGTTGERIILSVALDDLGIVDGTVISKVRAFTAIGSYHGGAIEIIDEARL